MKEHHLLQILPMSYRDGLNENDRVIKMNEVLRAESLVKVVNGE